MYKINLFEINLDIVRRLGINKVTEYCILPIKTQGDSLVVLSCKEILENKDEIEFIFNKKVNIKEMKAEDIEDLIYKAFLGEKENFLEIMLSKAIVEKASDIHFEPQKADVFIRIRIDGILVPFTKIKIEEYQKLLSKIKIIGNMDITEKRRPQDGKAFIKVDEKDYDLRLSTIPIVYGEKLVIRILYGEIFEHDISQINMSDYQREKLNKMISTKNGLVLVNGPTGSGKSTTLYSILKEINKKEINITTLEDPVEVLIEGINQVGLNRKANITFSTGLRSILRQDPDVIMIGEIRDEETATMAVTASLTGHKVYSTIHTKTPKEVYFRLEDMGVKSYLIRDSLIGIISQRLVRILCTKCKIVDKKISFNGKEVVLYKSNGCSYCNYSGYKGRKSVSSVVYMEEKVKKLITNIFQEIKELSNDEMIVNLRVLLENGLISYGDYNNFLLEEDLNYDKNKIII
ncbi:GspE/PulE family protein [Clostridium sp. AL.422]|uniref:GspE/PulE family protein n=1 Tax=Clostridium TaxID=1485 RepID=UPI00293DA5A2|nr:MULTISPECIES: GspE/PulE family protein [unclassified Clostridium]MDV4152540.1 GspE/PulE family protein [Clostridium sp. AL.422]